MRISFVDTLHVRRNEPLLNCPPDWKYYDCGSLFKGCCDVEACQFSAGCPRAHVRNNQATTVAAVAPPVLASSTTKKSAENKPSPTINSPRPSPTKPSRLVITTYFNSTPTRGAGGAWYTDTKPMPSRTAVSLSFSTITTRTSIPITSATASVTGKGDTELSVAVKGGIIGAVAAVVLAVIVAYFMCGKQRRKLRSRESIDSIDTGEVRNTVKEEDEHTPSTSANSFRPEDMFPPFEGQGRYEESRSRFNRVGDSCSNHKTMNIPGSLSSRESVNVKYPPAVMARSATTSPEYISRTNTATPEIQGCPQQAAIAELASPGLPRVVEIHSNRSGAQKYKPYRSNTASLYPVAETSPSYLTGTLKSTKASTR
ncbi:uncharacterized protein CTRU02_208822 [Colletotrichum truncatum]|uniref:Uncharacterized protein n=1 Tax=Colletotrichum truncatum TaxID=5467 RepID=A0ACC3YXR0_COLTU|nr:uncharacterized protein CTRU02_06520 [Colletotrichum truncatum]KAF6792437.1 hypothetical protein CTRU02_06520 [Colletotrichum truncatum]